MSLNNMPIRRKLMTLLLMKSSVILLVTCAAFVTYEIVTIRSGMVEGYSTRAKIIAANSTAALAFRNENDAMDVLSALKTDRWIVAACIYDAQGKIFVKYPADAGTDLFPVPIGVSGYRSGRLEIFSPVVQGERKLGTVYIQPDLSILTSRYRDYAWLSALILVAAFLLAVLLSNFLQKQITVPILALAETAKDITDLQNYSARAKKYSGDELGTLTDAFNRMLEEIQTQNESIKKLNESLERRIAVRTAELEATTLEVQEANRKLQELDKSKTEFFANVSHELRSPLTLILAPIESLLASTSAGNALVPPDVLKMVHNNAVRLLQMVNGLLDFSKVSAHKTEVNREPVNIMDLTRSLFSDFKGILMQKGLQNELSMEAPHPVVEMDRYLFERVFFNLISNAVKFTPRGGKISVRLKAERDRLTLSVTDTGVGISESDQKYLFEKFHQVDSSSTRRFEGTGLGLALAKEFAQLLDGTMTVESQVGKGSTFTLNCLAPQSMAKPGILVPAERKPVAAQYVDDTVKAKGFEGSQDDEELPKVLVAEDNPEMAAFIAGLLSPLCRIQVAVDGAEALEMVRRWRPQLVLSDVMMPKLDGIQLTKEIKGDKETSHIPVVLLTAMTNRESLMRGWEAGADDYLFKPFHPRELEARIKSLLGTIEWRKKSEAYRRQRDALEHFTHIASHDLKEPLRQIVNFVQLFQATQKNLDKDAEGYLDVISRSAARMYRLLDVLREYAQLDRETDAIKVEDLKEIIESVKEDLKSEMQRTHASIIVGELPELPVVSGQIALVFQNLISNGLKYRKDDVPPEIHIEALKKDYEWVFSVSDNGIGFDPKYAEKIFIMFERLHGTEKYQGDGMGLAICRKIIEKHGGKIWAESKQGEGSIFHFTLPVNLETSDRVAFEKTR